MFSGIGWDKSHVLQEQVGLVQLVAGAGEISQKSFGFSKSFESVGF